MGEQTPWVPPDKIATRPKPTWVSPDKVVGAVGNIPEAQGLKEKGTISNLFNRPIIRNANGSYSTTESFSIGTDKGEVLIPLDVGGKRLTRDQAIEHYRKTGEHLGIFDTPEHADKYATALHNEQDRVQGPKARTSLREDIEKNLPHRIDPSPLTFLDKFNVGRMDNTTEVKSYIENRFGKDKTMVKDGKVFVKVGGAGGATGWREVREGFLPSLLADAPELTGMTMGATAGARLGAAAAPETAGLSSVFGAVLGAAVGGSLGKAASEAPKLIAGEMHQSPSELSTHIAAAGKAGMEAEITGRAITPILGRLTRGPLPEIVTDTKKEGRALMTERTLSRGAMPPTFSTMPGAKRIQRYEIMAEKIAGPPAKQTAANNQYIDTRVREMLGREGYSQGEVNAILQDLAHPTGALSSEEVGRSLKAGVKAHTDALETSIQTDTANATRILDEQLAKLDALDRRYPKGSLGMDVAAGVEQARTAFGTASSKVYGQVDKLVGGAPIVPTTLMKKQAQRLVALLPESDATRPVIKAIADYPEHIPLQLAQRARTQLRQLMDHRNLTPNATMHDYELVADSIDRSFQTAGRDLEARFIRTLARGGTPDEVAEAESLRKRGTSAVRLLKVADDFYGQGVRKFKDARINQLVRQTKAGMAPDASVVAREVVQPGFEARTAELKKMLSPEVWGQVTARHWSNMLGKATLQDGTVSGQSLLKEVTVQGDRLLETTYGPRIARQIKNVAEGLAARDGRIPPEMLQPGQLQDVLKGLAKRQRDLDDFMKKDFLSVFANPKQTPEDAYNWLVQPKQTSRLREAIKFYGEDSEQVKLVRQHALDDIINRTLVRASRGGHGGSSLREAINSFTKDQQTMLFPKGLADDIRLLSEEMDFLFPSDHDLAMAGMEAGHILSHTMPFYRRWYYQAMGGLTRLLVQNPTNIRFMALGLRGDSKKRAAARATLRTLINYSALESTETGGE